jgi:hypothetical protein
LAQGQGDISTQLGIINGRKTLLAAFWLNFAQAIFDHPQSQIRPSYLSNSVIWLRNLIKSAQRVRHGSVESMRREIIDLTRQEAPVSNQ